MTSVKQQSFIFEDDRAFASCHASTLLHLQDGEVLAAWFAGTKESSPDVAIWMSRRGYEGNWTPPQIVADESGIPHWNPVLFRAGDGRIILYYKTGHKIPSWSTKVIESRDEGHTWSPPVELVQGDRGGRGPVKNKPLMLSSGRILSPASTEGDEWNGFADISDDDGISWNPSGVVPRSPQAITGKGVIQPTLWEMESGSVGMLLRSTGGSIVRSTSVDHGATWSAGERTVLPNNNSGIDLAKSASGVIALAYNPVDENWGARTPLDVIFSYDDGATWQDSVTLESQPGEYSYPAVVAQGSGFSVTYTWKRERIVYAELEA